MDTTTERSCRRIGPLVTAYTNVYCAYCVLYTIIFKGHKFCSDFTVGEIFIFGFSLIRIYSIGIHECSDISIVGPVPHQLSFDLAT